MIEVRLFTHPTCATCPNAIKLVERLVEQDPEVQMRFISLATPAGREVARAAAVLSVPTILVEETRFVGVPGWNDLLEAVERAKQGHDSLPGRQ